MELVQPFRFPRFIWEDFRENLRRLSPEVEQYIREKGLAWVNSLGEVRTIDDDEMFSGLFGKDMAISVWQAARDAINAKTNNKLTDIEQVKEVVVYHEGLHERLRESGFKEMVSNLRADLERILGERLTESHPLIQSFKAVYGEPSVQAQQEAGSLIAWYVEELMVLYRSLFFLINPMLSCKD